MSYPCRTVYATTNVGGGPCAMRATFFAKDDRAVLGHVCRELYAEGS